MRSLIGNLYETAGSRITKHIYLGDQMIAEVTTGAISYNHTDHLGGSNVLSGSTGKKHDMGRGTLYESLSSARG